MIKTQNLNKPCEKCGDTNTFSNLKLPKEVGCSVKLMLHSLQNPLPLYLTAECIRCGNEVLVEAQLTLTQTTKEVTPLTLEQKTAIFNSLSSVSQNPKLPAQLKEKLSNEKLNSMNDVELHEVFHVVYNQLTLQ